jgi:hypothetical protein
LLIGAVAQGSLPAVASSARPVEADASATRPQGAAERRPELTDFVLTDRWPTSLAEASAPTESPLAETGGTNGSGHGARPPLPERQPQEHLAPQLRDTAMLWESDESGQSPEETRERFARYQEGWQAARSEDAATGNDQDGIA